MGLLERRWNGHSDNCFHCKGGDSPSQLLIDLLETLNRPDFTIPMIRTNVLAIAAETFADFLHGSFRSRDYSELVGCSLHHNVGLALKCNGRLDGDFTNGAAAS